MAENKRSCAFKTSIGGQAIMEGILMRGVNKQAIVCRKADGSLVTKVEELHLIKERYPILGWPLIRGVAGFLDSMIKGVKALMWSAEQLPEEEQGEPGWLDRWIEKHFSSETAEKLIIYVAVVLGIAFAVLLFSFVPTLLAGLTARFIPLGAWRGLLEGVIRLFVFLGYLWLCSKLKDIKRIWQYHGAEHMTIFCYEHGGPLTVENARKESRLHPRCGTSFLFLVVFVSILVFSGVRTGDFWARMGLHLLLLPVIVGISYELIKLAGRYDNPATRLISAPGKALQHMTTAEPDDSMLEVAIEALKLVIPEEKGADAW
jgi:uncharacterized protein YqhQ